MSTNKDPQELMRQANEVVAQALGALEKSEAFYREQGLDPQKVQSVLAEQLDAKGVAEAQALFEQDMAQVEREVAEEAARASFASGPTRNAGAKKPQLMV